MYFDQVCDAMDTWSGINGSHAHSQENELFVRGFTKMGSIWGSTSSVHPESNNNKPKNKSIKAHIYLAHLSMQKHFFFFIY